MAYDPAKHHRRSIRLRGFDYSQPGAYFVTIVVRGRACLFGDVVDNQMRLNDAGRMAEGWFHELPNKFPLVVPDTYVIMPNHFHGIIAIVEGGAHTGGAHIGAPLQEMVQWFKTMTTSAYIRGVKSEAWPSFDRRLWQRNYHEHVIRDEADLARIREYITGNPAAWAADSENPAAHS